MRGHLVWKIYKIIQPYLPAFLSVNTREMESKLIRVIIINCEHRLQAISRSQPKHSGARRFSKCKSVIENSQRNCAELETRLSGERKRCAGLVWWNAPLVQAMNSSFSFPFPSAPVEGRNEGFGRTVLRSLLSITTNLLQLTKKKHVKVSELTF